MEDRFAADAVARIFADAPLGALDEAQAGGTFPAALWRTLEVNGFARALAPEALGGAGLPIGAGFAMAYEAGRAAAPVPLVEALAASWLLGAAGIAAPDGPLTLFAAPLGGPQRVAFGAAGAHVAGLGADRRVRLMAPPETPPATIALEEDMAATLGGDLRVAAEASAPNWLGPLQWRAAGAGLRAAQMAGALQAALDLTLAYTGGREQFGRPLAKFQAIQHHLADIAGEAAAAAAAVAGAAEAMEADPTLGDAAVAEIAAAKIRCGEAAGVVAALAHQAHGAMGYTRDYGLGRFTRRLWGWQDEFGDEVEWSRWLGAALISGGGPLWPKIAGG